MKTAGKAKREVTGVAWTEVGIERGGSFVGRPL